MSIVDIQTLLKEVYFQTTRSGGKGGQHLNKVSSKVELYLDIANSVSFTPEQKQLLFSQLAGRINQAGVLKITCEEDRSQLRNKGLAIEKLRQLLEDALKIRKKRMPSRPTSASRKKRIEKKIKHSIKKYNRQKQNFDT